MNPEKNTTTAIVEPDADTTTNDLTIKLSRTYTFEGKDIKELDLSGLDDLDAKDMMEADKFLARNGGISATPEMTTAYTCFIASRAAALPVEFFLRLKPKDAVRVKNTVMGFFYNDD